jgi:hypothetical protein
MGFCPYRESNPASSDSQPIHYTDYAIPTSGQTRNAYKIAGAKRKRTQPLSRICIYVYMLLKILLKRNFITEDMSTNWIYLTEGGFFNPSNESSCLTQVGITLSM